MGGPNGVIEIDNSTTLIGIGYHRCEWNVTVRPGRMIEVKFIEMSMANKDPKVCNRNFLMVCFSLIFFFLLYQEGYFNFPYISIFF